MSEFALTSKSYGNDDQRWIGNGGQPGLAPRSIVLDRSLFDLTGDWPDGVIPSGVCLAKVTATGLYGPYGGNDFRTEEIVTLTEGGSGLTSWTATFGGQTTTSLDDDATTAQVQAALEALSTIGEGNVEVTGTTAPIAMSVKFVGDLANTNVGAITTTPTGGTGTVVVAVGTAGGAETVSDGREVLAGHLFAAVTYDRNAASTADLPGALFWDGEVIETYLPEGAVDTAGKADVANNITYITDVVGED